MRRISLTSHSAKGLVAEAVKILHQGGTVAYPTETAYGLGADFFNPLAVKKVYAIKGRSFKKRLSVLVSSLAQARKLVKLDSRSLKLARKYWPGPLTLVLPAVDGKETLAVRQSSAKLATALIRKLGRPITATSANLSGRPENYSAEEVIKSFKNRKRRPDLVLDAGRLPQRKDSTAGQAVAGKGKGLRQDEIKV